MKPLMLVLVSCVLLSICPQVSYADKWQLFERTDEFTDEDKSVARLGRSLYVKCAGNGGYHLWFDHQWRASPPIFDKLVKVRYRFGKGKVFDEIWHGRAWKVHMPTRQLDFSHWLTSGEDFVIEFDGSGYSSKPFRETYRNNISQRLLYVIAGCNGTFPE